MAFSINDLDQGFRLGYEQARASGYNATFEQWFVDHMHNSGAINSTNRPEEVGLYEQLTGQSTGRLPGLMSAAATVGSGNILSQHADLLAAFNAAKATNPALDASDFLVDFANAHPDDARFNDPAFLAAAGIETNDLPFEQALGGYVTDTARTDIANDAARGAWANSLISGAGGQQDAVNQTIADLFPTLDRPAVAPAFTASGYLAANPDLTAAFNGLGKDATGRAVMPDGRTLTLEEFARDHWNTYGQTEGRGGAMDAGSPAVAGQASKMYRDSIAASNVARDEQLAALSEQLAALRGNLAGELAAKAAALETQLATLTGSLDTLTAAQRDALATQMATQLASLETDVAARKASLATALETMQGAVGTEADARRAALETELTGLNAAQAPLNAARTASAQAQVTAVNLGLESTRDRIAAQAARDGFIGSSSGTDASLARAAIMARQQAAQAVADANVANAGDTSRIAQYGATKGAGITENAAGANTAITNYGATEGRAVADYGSGQTRTLTDYGASETRGISNADATGRASITNYGAGETRGLSDFGAASTRAIGDLGANDTRSIKDAASSRALGYFDLDLQRRLASLSLPSANVRQQLDTARAADEFGQSGLNRTFSNLGFFAANPTSAPGTTPFFVQPAPDDGMANLGAGIASLGGAFANANNWGQPNKPAPVLRNPTLPTPTFNGTIGSFA